MSSFFDVKEQRPTMNLEKYYQCSVNIEISLDLKVCFSLVSCKINNLIALCSTNQIIEISASWWLISWWLTSNRMVSHAINDKFAYYKTMRLLVNNQIILIEIQSKSISLEQICSKRSQGVVVTSLHCLLFSTLKKKT